MTKQAQIQVCRFPQGGFVLHKITGSFKGTVSAWFEPDGTMTSGEQLYWNGTRSAARDVKQGGPIWNEIAPLGRIYKA